MDKIINSISKCCNQPSWWTAVIRLPSQSLLRRRWRGRAAGPGVLSIKLFPRSSAASKYTHTHRLQMKRENMNAITSSLGRKHVHRKIKFRGHSPNCLKQIIVRFTRQVQSITLCLWRQTGYYFHKGSAHPVFHCKINLYEGIARNAIWSHVNVEIILNRCIIH